MHSTHKWAQDEFGDVDLGDVRLGRRLVMLASEVAARPAGTVTRACATPASREAAFRLLENTRVRSEAIEMCVQAATLRRCTQDGFVFVPIDGTSLQITDEKRSKGLGAVGAWGKGARGVQVMTALAIAEQGQPLGVVAQKKWVRKTRSRRSGKGAVKYGGENDRWVETLKECAESFAEAAPLVTPWYQCDRGADCWQVLSYAAKTDMLITVRAVHDRRLDEHIERLWQTVRKAPVVAKKTIEVPARGKRWRKKRVDGRQKQMLIPAQDARRARVSIRASSVPLTLSTPDGKVVNHFNAVLVHETTPSKDPVEWLLLTSHSIDTRDDVLKVVHGYTLRWRIEEFHRAWKSGICRVEDTQLRTRDAIYKWATLLASVATRAMRLAHQARIVPDAPATSEFTTTELEALIALREPKGLGDRVPTLGQAVRWLAELGGYTGPWNGPPGPTVIGRGLYDLLVVSRAFDNRASAKRNNVKRRAKM